MIMAHERATAPAILCTSGVSMPASMRFVHSAGQKDEADLDDAPP